MKQVFLLLMLIFVIEGVGQVPAPNLNLPTYFESQQYKWNGWKYVGLSLVASASFVDGVRTGWIHDNRKSFERKWGADPNGFWGSESWRQIYVDGDPANGLKSYWHRQVGAIDFEHFSDRYYKSAYICGGTLIGIGITKNARPEGDWLERNQYWIFDLLITFGVSTLSKRAGMRWVRGQNFFQ